MKNVIYKIRNLTNGKFYVGSTVDARVRFQTHRRKLRAGKHQSPHMQAAWNKYGEDCFKFEIVEVVPEGEDLLAAEQKWLDDHAGKPYCYNWAIDASAPMRGKKHTEAAKALSAERRKGKHAGENHYRYGKTVSEETRKKIGDAQRGKKKQAGRTVSEEGKAKIRASVEAGRWSKGSPPNDFQAVLAKFPEEVRNRYDFSNAVYTGALVRIEGCVCPEHGTFSQYSAQFRKGRGCPQCGAAQRAVSKRKQMLEAWSNPEEREKMMKARIKLEI